MASADNPLNGTWCVGPKHLTLSTQDSIVDSILTVVEHDADHPLRMHHPPAAMPMVKHAPPAPPTSNSSMTQSNQEKSSHVGNNEGSVVVALKVGELDPLSALMMSASSSVPETSSSQSKNAPLPTMSISTHNEEKKNQLLEEWARQKESIFQSFAAETLKVNVPVEDNDGDEDEKRRHLLPEEENENAAIKERMASKHDKDSQQNVVPSVEIETGSEWKMKILGKKSHAIQQARARLAQLEAGTMSSQPSSHENPAHEYKMEKPTLETTMTTLEVSQAEYVRRIQNLQTDFELAWKDDQKVLALRLAIKVHSLQYQ
jgi:hypothetical protein